MITCVPEIKVLPHTPGSNFVLVACDGIWDCLTSVEAIDVVKNFFKTQKTAPISTCIEQIFDKIIASDVASSGGIGCDNMTAVIVELKH